MARLSRARFEIANDFSFDPSAAPGTHGGLYGDTLTDEVLHWLCGEALPKIQAKLMKLQVKFPDKYIDVESRWSRRTRNLSEA